jgi:hypothetical protein
VSFQLYNKVKQEATFFLGRRLPRCDDLLVTMSESLDRSLTLREKIKMRMHFLICAFCKRYLQQLRILHKSIGRLAAVETESSTSSLSDGARERIKRALEVEG